MVRECSSSRDRLRANPRNTCAGGINGAADFERSPGRLLSSSESESAFACRVDDVSFAPCDWPTTTGALADGQHTFSVRAIDTAGNVDSTEATRVFTVDTL